MSVDALVHATASLTLEFSCCDECCKPTFFFLVDDPTEEIISRSSKHKFYVVKKVQSECTFAASTDHTDTIEAPLTINAHARSNFALVITRISTNAFRADNSRKVLSRVREPACLDQSAEVELLSAQGSTLLVGNSLREVEDDNDDEVIQAGGARFYSVFGSPRVGTSRDAAVAELVAKNAPGLLVGHSLAVVDDPYTFLPTFYPAAAYRSLILTYEPACPNYVAGFNYIECGESVECAWSFAMGSAKRRNARDMPALVPAILKVKL
ncbi:hypothetical protein B0H14DRAFT_3438004 [Mycena olivaceomarginata]|nr:hypothetical protein B0H14DRAFT_3438004 [Mycena olivaceomarginata]